MDKLSSGEGRFCCEQGMKMSKIYFLGLQNGSKFMNLDWSFSAMALMLLAIMDKDLNSSHRPFATVAPLSFSPAPLFHLYWNVLSRLLPIFKRRDPRCQSHHSTSQPP